MKKKKANKLAQAIQQCAAESMWHGAAIGTDQMEVDVTRGGWIGLCAVCDRRLKKLVKAASR